MLFDAEINDKKIVKCLSVYIVKQDNKDKLQFEQESTLLTIDEIILYVYVKLLKEIYEKIFIPVCDISCAQLLISGTAEYKLKMI